MAREVDDWTGFHKCGKCGAEADRPCWNLRYAQPTPGLFPHDGRGKDRERRYAIGQAKRSATRRFNRSIGLP